MDVWSGYGYGCEKTVIKGKQNDTSLGETTKDGGIYMTHGTKIVATDSAPVTWNGMTMASHDLMGHRAF